MLKNDLLLRAARRERTQRTPVWLMRQAGRFDPRYREIRERAGLTLEALFRDPDLAAEISLLPRRFGVDAIIFFQDILTPLDPMGARFVFRPGPRLKTPIRTSSDIEALRPLDPSSDLDFVSRILQLVRKELAGDLPLLGFAGAPLTLAFFLIEGQSPSGNSDRTQTLLRADPALLHRLLDKLATMTVEYLRLQIEAGVDAVQLFESAADLVSSDQYAEFAHPYHVRIFSELNDRARSGRTDPSRERKRPVNDPALALGARNAPCTSTHGHLGRHVPTILFAKDQPAVELMAESGADVLSVSPCVDLADAKKRVGHRVALQGNVDNRLLVTGSFDQIDQAVRACVQAGGRQGHILNLGHGLLPDTPVDNVRRFIEASRGLQPAREKTETVTNGEGA